MRRALALALAVAAVGLAACGEEEPPASDSVPAAGENTPPAGTPGVPEGAPYDLDGNRWIDLAEGEQVEAAEAYVADNPDRCDGANPDDVAAYAASAYGNDFPLDIPVADVLAEGCDASRQS